MTAARAYTLAGKVVHPHAFVHLIIDHVDHHRMQPYWPKHRFAHVVVNSCS